jgi:hypothetical protein
MKSVKVTRQFRNQFWRHRHRAGIAKAGCNAIDGALFAQTPLQEIGAAGNERAKCRLVG